jgi:hypothetical protein
MWLSSPFRSTDASTAKLQSAFLPSGAACGPLDIRNERRIRDDAGTTTDLVGRDPFPVGPPRLRRQTDDPGVRGVPDDQAVVAVDSRTPPVPAPRILAVRNELGEMIP